MGFRAFGKFTMTSQQFARLQPHDKTLMALLVRERMREVGDERPVHADIDRHTNVSHAYKMPEDAPISSIDPDVGNRIISGPQKNGNWPRVAADVLKLMAAVEDTIEVTKDQLAERVGVSRTSIERAVASLLVDGLIARAGGVYLWQVTSRGREVVSTLQAKPAA